MAVRTILTFPNPVLQRKANPVVRFDETVTQLVADMIDTMRAENGIGLAAPQIGESLRVIVLEIPEEGDDEGPRQLYVVCNPEITERKGNAKIEEGCLSCPGLYVEIDRSKEIRLEGKNSDGTPLTISADGLLSICLQHEIDHLDGKLLVNYVSPIKRALYKNEIKRKKRAGTEEEKRPVI